MADVTSTPMSWTTPDGIELIGETRGEGPAVILVHGGFQTRNSWAAAATELAETGYRAITFDLRGHGDSARSPQGHYSTQYHALDVAGIVAELEEPVALVGASLGGMACMWAAGERSDGGSGAVSAIVLVDVVPRLETSGADRIRSFMLAYPDGFDSLDQAADLIAEYVTGGRRPARGKGIARSLRQGPDGRYRWHWDPRLITTGMDAYGEPEIQHSLAVAAAVKVPMLLLRGELSDVVSPAGVAELRAAAPDLEYEEIAGVGHMVAGVANNPFVAGILRFLGVHVLRAG